MPLTIEARWSSRAPTRFVIKPYPRMGIIWAFLRLRIFLLLVPAAADKNPDSLIEFQEIIRLIKQASGTNHPNPLYLTVPASAGAAVFREAEEGHWALEAKTKAKPAGGGSETDFPLAIILIGKAEG